MTGHDDDLEELRPLGEASLTPDHRLDERGDGIPCRQRFATSKTGYPARSTEPDTDCRSCGVRISATQTKCRFCFTNYLDGGASEPERPTPDRTLLGMVHFLVESSSVYGAVAKGSAAANLLSASESASTVDECTLIADLDGDPAPQLTEHWPSLPEAATVASTEGEQLLAAAWRRMGESDDPASVTGHSLKTHLYDESGSAIRSESHLEVVLESTSFEVWIVPTLAITVGTEGSEPACREMAIPNTERLDCRRCECVTEHRFHTRESLPEETWSGQPIWECRECGAYRYGSDPGRRTTSG